MLSFDISTSAHHGFFSKEALADTINLLSELEQCEQIQINLNNNYIDDKFVSLASAINNNKALHTINLAHNDIENISEYAALLCNNTTLVELNLRYNDIGNVGLAQLSAALGVNKRSLI